MKKSMNFGSGSGSTSSCVECVDIYYSDDDDIGFTEGEPLPGKSIATFNFAAPDGRKTDELPAMQKTAQPKLNEVPFTASSVNKFNPKGITPPVDGELFTVKRSYQMRPSTVKKLNELKAKHPDFNVYLNTILDEAIAHYYNYIVNEGGHFST